MKIPTFAGYTMRILKSTLLVNNKTPFSCVFSATNMPRFAEMNAITAPVANPHEANVNRGRSQIKATGASQFKPSLPRSVESSVARALTLADRTLRSSSDSLS